MKTISRVFGKPLSHHIAIIIAVNVADVEFILECIDALIEFLSYDINIMEFYDNTNNIITMNENVMDKVIL